MITLEQIRTLESKVQKAVELIEGLRSENAMLTKKLETYQKRINELEILVEEFKQDQVQIEQGIIHALNQLEELEDVVAKDKISLSEAKKDIPAEKKEKDTPEAAQEKDTKGSTAKELDIF